MNRRNNSGRVRVLMLPGQSAASDNPYVQMLVEHLDPTIEVVPFSWKRALMSRYDVLHVHWPEHLLRAPSMGRRSAKRFALVLLLARNRLLRVHNVETMHNLNPHEGLGRIDAISLRSWKRSCHKRIVLTRSHDQSGDEGQAVYIPHGDYSPIVDPSSAPKTAPIRGRALIFGQVRPYKNIEATIALVKDVPNCALSALRIVGAPVVPQYAEAITRHVQSLGDRRVDLRLEALDNEALLAEISQAEYVVLPQRRPYSSGAAILALTMRRPVVVAESLTMRELQDECGPGWVQLVPEWTALGFSEAVSRLRGNARHGGNPLRGRNWSEIGAAHARLYAELGK